MPTFRSDTAQPRRYALFLRTRSAMASATMAAKNTGTAREMRFGCIPTASVATPPPPSLGALLRGLAQPDQARQHRDAGDEERLRRVVGQRHDPLFGAVAFELEGAEPLGLFRVGDEEARGAETCHPIADPGE